MPPWGAGSKPKKTPANTVRNSTYSTSNRFGGPPGTTTPGGPPGSGRASQISRPAMAAAAVAKRPNYGPPGTRTPGGPPGTGSPSQISRPSVPQPNRGYVSPAAVDRRATTQPSNTADRNMMNQARRAGPMDRGSVAQPNTPQASPYAGLDLTSRANTNARMVLPSEVEQRAAIAAGGTAYNPAQTARIADIRNNATAAYQGPGPSADMLAQGSQGAQEQEVYRWLGTEDAQNLLASNAAAAAPAAAAPAWDPANNDPAMTDPVGMWTDPLSGGQMPDPADAEAWERMQRVADSEFGPGQDIYNPEYDTERFPTYDPNDTIAPFARGATGGGGGGFGGGAGGGYGGGAGPELGTYNPNTGEYLQFGLNLAQNTSDYGRVGEGRGFWNQAQDRRWDEYNRGLPGQYNSRGMLDSGLLTRAEGLAASDRRFETDVRQWSDNEQLARLERQRLGIYGDMEGGLTQGLMGDYLAGTLTPGMGSQGGYMRSGIMDRAIPERYRLTGGVS